MSGGGGGDGGVAIQQQQEAKKARAREAINRIFGIGQSTSPYITAPQQSQYGTRMYDDEGQEIFTPDVEGYQDALSAFNSSLIAPDVEANKKARDDAYARVRQATLDVSKQKLNEDREPAARQLRFALMRTGNSGGSLDIDQNNLLQRKYDQGLLDATNASDSAALGAKTSDERARLDLLSRIDAGMDQGSAIQGATSQLQNSADQAIATAKGQTLGNVFDNAGLLYQANQIGQGNTNASQLFQKMRSVYNSPFSAGAANGRVVGNT